MHSVNSLKISVTIPYYQGEQYIRECVQSILDNTFPVRRIYIVDNSPEPATFPFLAGLHKRQEQVEIIRTRPGIGFGRACNIGVYQGLAAGDDVCVILNQDAILDSRCLEFLTRPFALDQKIFAAIPVSMTYDLKDFNPKTLANYIVPVKGLLRDWLLNQLKPFYSLEFDQGNAACVAFRADNIPQVGLFDPFFRMYGEDLELFQRAQKGYGLKIVLAPESRIGHRHSNFSLTGREADRIEVKSRHGRQIAQIKNPGKAFPAALLEAFIRNLRPYLRALRAGNLYQVGRYAAKDLKILVSLPLIYRSRRPAYLQQRIEAFLKTDPERNPRI